MAKKVDAQCILQVLPSLSEDVLKNLLEKLEEVGVSTCDDLPYVCESDISSVLRPILVRRLLEQWRIAGNFVIYEFLYSFANSKN